MGRGNARFETDEIQRHAELFDRIESHPLTRLQRLAVVRNEDCGLVVAGAGSGKTSTLIARVAYLLESGLAEPGEILLLTFSKGAARELRARITKRLGATIEAGTFHSMGHAIIGAATGAVPRLCGEADDEKGADKPTKDMIESLCRRDARFAAATIALAAYYRGAYTPHWEFQDQTEYERYVRRVERRPLSGARVRSYEECVIANWLTLKGIRYEYERPYEYRTASASRRQYQPDFYLPDYGIYIEHFGVSRAGDVAPYIDRDQYLAGMEWKRELHRSHGTTLIETYAWMHAEDVLLDTLERELRDHRVRLTELDPDEALQALNKLGAVHQTAQLIVQFRALAKGLSQSPSHLRSRAAPADSAITSVRSLPRRLRAPPGRVRAAERRERRDRLRGHAPPGGRLPGEQSVCLPLPPHHRRRVPGCLRERGPPRQGPAEPGRGGLSPVRRR